MSKNPCTICEKFMKGIKCDEVDDCPVGQMKAENARLKRRLTKYENDHAWDEPNGIDFFAMGRQGTFG